MYRSSSGRFISVFLLQTPHQRVHYYVPPNVNLDTVFPLSRKKSVCFFFNKQIYSYAYSASFPVKIKIKMNLELFEKYQTFEKCIRCNGKVFKNTVHESTIFCEMTPYPIIPSKVYPRVVHTKNKHFAVFWSEVHLRMTVSDVTCSLKQP